MEKMQAMMGDGDGDGGGFDMEKLQAMMGGMGGGPPPPPVTGVHEDVPPILCATCKLLVKRTVSVIQERLLRRQHKPTPRPRHTTPRPALTPTPHTIATQVMRDAKKTTKLGEETILEMIVGDPGHHLPNAPATASGGAWCQHLSP